MNYKKYLSIIIIKIRQEENPITASYFTKLAKELEHKERTLQQDNYTTGKLEERRAKKREAKHVGALMKVWNNTLWSAKDIAFYIIPSRWFAKWKAYIDYDEARSFSQSGTNFAREPERPGPITYKELLAEDKEHLHNYSVPGRLRDKVIKSSAEEGRNYFVGSKELCEYLQEKYGGEGILRYQYEIGCNGLKRFYPKLVRVKNTNNIIGKDYIYKEREDIM